MRSTRAGGTVIFDVSWGHPRDDYRRRPRRTPRAELLSAVKSLLKHFDDATPGTPRWFDAAAVRALVRRLDTE